MKKYATKRSINNGDLAALFMRLKTVRNEVAEILEQPKFHCIRGPLNKAIMKLDEHLRTSSEKLSFIDYVQYIGAAQAAIFGISKSFPEAETHTPEQKAILAFREQALSILERIVIDFCVFQLDTGIEIVDLTSLQSFTKTPRRR